MKILGAVLMLLLTALPAAALSPSRAVLLALADADQQAAEDQPFYRYLYHPGTDDEILAFLPALRFHVNFLSRESSLAYPVRVATGLYRVDLRSYQWSAQTFDKLADIDPYFHRKNVVEVDVVVEVEIEVEVEIQVEIEVEIDQEYGNYDQYGKWKTTEIRKEKVKKKVPRKVIQKQIKKEKRKEKKVRNLLYVPQGAGQLASLALLLQSQAPVVRADWFLVQSARQLSLNNKDNGVGYYDFLGFKSRDDVFKLIGLDPKVAARTEIRAVVNRSGVATHNRQIVQDGATTGPHWFTLEVDDQSGRGIAINNLRRGEFLHKAEEHYFHLPNGMPGVLACTDQGVLQAVVPPQIAGDRSQNNVSNDLQVHVGINCIRCHRGAVLMPFEDDVRKLYTGRLSTLSLSRDIQLELDRNYGTNILKVLNRDTGDYQDVFQQVSGGLKPTQAADAYSNAFNRYAYEDVTLDQAGKELGVSGLALRKALKDGALRLGFSDFRLDPFIADTPGVVQRLTWEDVVQDAQDHLYGILDLKPKVNE